MTPITKLKNALAAMERDNPDDYTDYWLAAEGLRSVIAEMEAQPKAEPAQDKLRDYLRNIYGYRAGNYMNKCLNCGIMMGAVDKRCFTCISCADKSIDRAIEDNK